MITKVSTSIVFVVSLCVFSSCHETQSFPFSERVTKLECIRGLLAADINLLNFEMFPVWFRDDSEYILAQAGSYVGADNIEEYARFTSGTSPYMKTVTEVGVSFNFRNLVQVSDDGICSFLQAYVADFVTDPAYAAPVKFRTIAMIRAFLDPREGYFPRVHIFFSSTFLNYFFSQVLNTPQTKEYVCSAIEDSCGYTDQVPDCIAALNELEVAEGEAFVDGNSFGCRALHAAFAPNNTIRHCPHISFDPILDVDGAIKCQSESAQGVLPEDLFDPEDIEFFERIMRRNNLGPDGYIELPLE